MKPKVILASQSPRRRELLRLLFHDFDCCVPDVDESLPDATPPAWAVEMLAQRKAQAVAQQHPDALVIGSDTLVALDNIVLGKPVDAQDAARMLGMLSGNTHQVFTGVAIAAQGKLHSFVCGTLVRFAPMTDQEIAWYIATGEPMDKAGAYGIQGLGARFIQSIDGDYFTVMGLPVRALYEALHGFIQI